MKIFKCKIEKVPKLDNCIACIGNFDGVHRGHQALLKVTKDLAKMNDVKAAVICFYPDVIDVLTKKKNKHILSQKQRCQQFEKWGMDYCIEIEFCVPFQNMTPIAFIQNYLLKLSIQTLVFGFDFHFGYQNKGDGILLSSYFNTIQVDEMKLYGEKISSSKIRTLLSEGKMGRVNQYLGYPFYFPVKIKKVSKTGCNWLIQAIPKYKSQLLPLSYQQDDFVIEKDHLEWISKEELFVHKDYTITYENKRFICK